MFIDNDLAVTEDRCTPNDNERSFRCCIDGRYRVPRTLEIAQDSQTTNIHLDSTRNSDFGITENATEGNGGNRVDKVRIAHVNLDVTQDCTGTNRLGNYKLAILGSREVDEQYSSHVGGFGLGQHVFGRIQKVVGAIVGGSGDRRGGDAYRNGFIGSDSGNYDVFFGVFVEYHGACDFVFACRTAIKSWIAESCGARRLFPTCSSQAYSSQQVGLVDTMLSVAFYD